MDPGTGSRCSTLGRYARLAGCGKKTEKKKKNCCGAWRTGLAPLCDCKWLKVVVILSSVGATSCIVCSRPTLAPLFVFLISICYQLKKKTRHTIHMILRWQADPFSDSASSSRLQSRNQRDRHFRRQVARGRQRFHNGSHFSSRYSASSMSMSSGSASFYGRALSVVSKGGGERKAEQGVCLWLWLAGVCGAVDHVLPIVAAVADRSSPAPHFLLPCLCPLDPAMIITTTTARAATITHVSSDTCIPCGGGAVWDFVVNIFFSSCGCFGRLFVVKLAGIAFRGDQEGPPRQRLQDSLRP